MESVSLNQQMQQGAGGQAKNMGWYDWMHVKAEACTYHDQTLSRLAFQVAQMVMDDERQTEPELVSRLFAPRDDAASDNPEADAGLN